MSGIGCMLVARKTLNSQTLKNSGKKRVKKQKYKIVNVPEMNITKAIALKKEYQYEVD